ncbi:MAG: family 10 glycosylhydrolase [Myxococcota bacterium]|nr:family 10 glycosylhydrolase [Myxococcota bacterium]
MFWLRREWGACWAAFLLLACSQGDMPAGTAHQAEAAIDPPVAEGEAIAVAEPEPAEAPTPEGVRGLWVLAEGSQRVLEDADEIVRLVEEALALGATDLFVQVYRGGRAWYNADLADASPYRTLVAQNDQDTLYLLLQQAHAAGIRVHGWVNVLSLSTNTAAPILQDLGPEAVLVDRFGRSVLDYPNLELPAPDRQWYRMGTRGVYLDAGAPGVRERLVDVFAELIDRYPSLDGLHLDYIRHPGALPFVPGSRFGVGLDFGYGQATQERFRRETGLRGPYRDPESPDPTQLVNTTAWDDWRRAQVTALVKAIHKTTKAQKPNLILSAAVNSYTDRAYLSLAQDWLRWLEEDLIDWAIPMAYTRDDRLLRYQLEDFAHRPHGDRIVPGLGVWLFAREPERALAQVKIAQDAGLPGEVLFSYDSILDAPALQAALERSIEPDLSP